MQTLVISVWPLVAITGDCDGLRAPSSGFLTRCPGLLLLAVEFDFEINGFLTGLDFA